MSRSILAKVIGLLLLLMLIVSAFGCTGLMIPQEDKLMTAAHYAELESYMESKVKDLHSASSVDLFHLCTAYARLKKYNKLFPCLDQWDTNIAKGDTTWYFFDISPWPPALRAEAFLELGDYGKAVEQARKGYDIVIKKDLARATRIQSLSILGLSLAFNGEREKAMEYAKALEDIGTGYPFTFLKTDKVIGLARIYMALGDYQKSLDYIREDESLAFARGFAQAAVVMIGGTLSGDSIFAYNQLPKAFILNKSLYETGKIEEAKNNYDSLLKNPQTRDNADIYWMSLFDRGKIADSEGKRREAIDFYSRAVELIEQQRSTINTEASKIGFVGDKQSVYSRLIGALYADGQYASAFEYVERSKSRALVDLLATKQDFSVKAGDERQVRSLLDMDKKAETDLLVQDITPEKSKTRSVVINSRQQLQNVSPELSSLVSVTSLSAPEIQSLIPPDEVLVEYYYSDKDMFAFILTKEELKSVRLANGNLVEEIRKFRNLLENPGSGDHLPEAQRLYRLLVQPLGSMAGKRNLTIVPHGALHYLPFNALHDGDGYLIDRYSIRMLPSASVIKYLNAKRPSKAANILAFGNPDLGDSRYDLTYAQEEARAIARTLPQSRVLLRKDATETAFKKYGADYNYIHFATHGQFNPDAPLKSSLLLARDNENDGMLTVDKLYSMRLNADLVTLSACETGLGKIANGDDVVGLTRGFLYAGSSSIVASLWKVDDLATSNLMTEFYSALRKSGKREALRQAQLNTRAKYPHPYYWASFQLTGNSE